MRAICLFLVDLDVDEAFARNHRACDEGGSQKSQSDFAEQ